MPLGDNFMDKITSINTSDMVCKSPDLQSFPVEPDPELTMEQSICAPARAGLAFEATSEMDGQLMRLSKLPLTERIECIAHKFLGLPYKIDPLGEGPNASVDPDPMYRFDAHDCMTMVEHVIALASAKSSAIFMDHLSKIRYRDAKVSYGSRLHFVSVDWLPENIKNGFVREITHEVGGKAVSSVHAKIDRVRWVWNNTNLKTLENKLKTLTPLFAAGKNVSEYTEMDYIPISAFFMSDPNYTTDGIDPVELLPEVSLMLMIDDQKDVDRIGVIVRHMALLFKPRGEEPFMVHGSSRRGEIYAESFLDYIASQEPYRAGVAIFEILDKTE